DNIGDYTEMFGVQSKSGLAGADDSLIMPYRGAIQSEQDLFIVVDYMQANTSISGEPSTGHAPNANLASDLSKVFEGDPSFTSRTTPPHAEANVQLKPHDYVGYGPCTTTGAPRDMIDYYTRKSDPALYDQLMLGAYHFVLAGHAPYSVNQDGTCNF